MRTAGCACSPPSRLKWACSTGWCGKAGGPGQGRELHGLCQYVTTEKHREQDCWSGRWCCVGGRPRQCTAACGGEGGDGMSQQPCGDCVRVAHTFLEALDRSIADCREFRGMNWAGRSPLLGSIVRCRPKSFVEAQKVLHLFSQFAKPYMHLDQKTTLHD